MAALNQMQIDSIYVINAAANYKKYTRNTRKASNSSYWLP